MSYLSLFLCTQEAQLPQRDRATRYVNSCDTMFNRVWVLERFQIAEVAFKFKVI